MKISISIITCAFAALGLGSCLKDTPYLDVSNSQPIIEFGLSPAQGVFGPFVYGVDTANSPDVDTAIAVVVASPQVLNVPVSVTVKVDTTQISAYNSANDSTFMALPDSLYSLTTTTTVAAGYRVGRVSLTLNLSKFPAHHKYALPLAIVSASENSGQSLVVSGNSGTFMWLFDQ